MDSKNSSDSQIGLGLRPRPILAENKFEIIFKMAAHDVVFFFNLDFCKDCIMTLDVDGEDSVHVHSKTYVNSLLVGFVDLNL